MNIKSERFDWRNRAEIESRIQDTPQPDEEKIIKYLKSGNEIAQIYAPVTDVFSLKIWGEGSGVYTDGEWEWNDPLTYYVKKYHYKISDEFVEHMKKNNWKVRRMTKGEVREYCEKKYKSFDDERAIALLESGLQSVNEGLSFKVYNLEYMRNMTYRTNTKYHRNDLCVIDGIKLKPFDNDI